MKRKHRVKNKELKTYQNYVGQVNGWDREAWVREVLRIASFKYNLEDADFKRFTESLGGKKSK